MPQIVSVKFRFSPKALWFDPKEKEYEVGTEVLVETERGREVGVVYESIVEVTDKQISALKSPLKPVIRELTDLDCEHIEALEKKGKEALPIFREKIHEYGLDIKPVEVQYLFSGDRAIFFFSSEERVDFRELVRDLAHHFHLRIDMRQIGARDEAKQLGGLAHCGEPFCCTRFGGEFHPVSIRMAKEQDLPLNPAKISGACGRLMCCLRYEYEAYKDFKKRVPKKGTTVDTPLGEAVISGYNTPGETMELKLEDGKRLSVPCAEVDCSKDSKGNTCCKVNHETIARCATRSMLIALGSLDQQLGETLSADYEDVDVDIATETGGERRRRRNTKKKSGAAANDTSRTTSSGSQERASGGKSSRGKTQGAQDGRGKQGEKEAQGVQGAQGSRRRRRRSNEGGERQDSPARKPQQQTQESSQKKAAAPQKDRDPGMSEERPRPGQRSSGLRRPRKRTISSDQTTSNSSGQTSALPSEPAQNDTRRKRQRSNGSRGGQVPRRTHSGNSSESNSGNNSRSNNSGGNANGNPGNSGGNDSNG